MSDLEAAPQPEPEVPPGSSADQPDPDAAALVPENEQDTAVSFIEGEFIENPTAPVTEPAPEPVKRKLSPALLALITILGLFFLCCLMAVIVFFLVYPAVQADGQTGVILPVQSLALLLRG